MHNGTRTENNLHGGDYNMHEEYKKLNKERNQKPVSTVVEDA